MPEIKVNAGKYIKPKPVNDVSGIRTRNVFESYGLGDMDTSMSQKPTYDYKPPPAPRATIDPRPPARDDDPLINVQRMMDEIGGFDNTDRDAFRQSIQEMPMRDQNKPSIARRLVASGMGLGNKDPLKTMDSVLDKPYTDKLQEWKDRVEPRYKSAQLENTANANERQLRSNILTNETNMRRYEQADKNAEEKNAISRMIAEAKANKWDVKIDGPNIVATSPDGQSSKVIGRASGMSKFDELNLRGQWNTVANQARVNSQASNQVAAGAQFAQDPDGNWHVVNPRTDPPQLPPPNSRRPGTVSSPAPKNRAEKNREIQFNMDNLYRTSPADKRWLIPTGDGTYRPRPRPIVGEKDNRTTTMGFGGTAYTQDDVDAYDATMQSIDPEYKPPAAPTARVATGATTGVAPGTIPAQGGRGALPANGRGAPPPTAAPGVGRSNTPAASKPRLRVMDPKTGRTGTIANTEEEINNAMKQGLRVEAGGQ